jgi:hypothetical protein
VIFPRYLASAVETLLLLILIAVVAALYASVGHGGASGYLAVLSLFAFAPQQLSSTSLALNVLVSALSFYSFAQAKHFRFPLAWPLIVASVPLAFVGGLIQVSDRAYFILLALALLIAAYRMWWNAPTTVNGEMRKPSLGASLATGGGIGLLSGIVGVGGGIFLSPLMILMRWADPKQTAAVSAFFILVNSLAGIAGRFARGGFELSSTMPFVAAALVGGFAGSYVGAQKFSGFTLRRVLSIVLVLAAAKLVMMGMK